MTELTLEPLESLDLGGSGLRRRPRQRAASLPEGFAAAYDYTTLWYHAFPTDSGLAAVAPSLLNLRRPLMGAAVDVAGEPARIARIRRRRRHDVIDFACPRPDAGGGISVRIGDWTGRAAVAPDRSAVFAGLNAAVTVQKDNRLDWIADWVRWHRGEHGLEAVLIFDNGSTAYMPQELLDALASLGLKAAMVVTVPHTWGALVRGGNAKFLQPALLNIARLNHLRRARAVLQCDIDELFPPTPVSIFDMAVTRPLGLLPLTGRWVSPPPGAAAPFRHAQHTHRIPGRPSPTKYVVVPQGRLRGLSWEVHGLERFPPLAWLAPKAPQFWHFRTISTNWKWQRQPAADGVADPGMAKALAARLTRDG